MNEWIATIKRVIAKRQSRGAGDRDIQLYIESLVKNIKNEDVRQAILNIEKNKKGTKKRRPHGKRK
ncbi:hypothetical protein [Paenibacillus woosongensis]|uniref:PH domain-containing protein n=1 Tax=Paenibacillus woosongensis TaxID=307580 RepID=A0ABQ4MYT4_9BACL|nr:hypothetical protein [Paenibacillus woosongensis]GIP61103.1 hypothetical protein J15TS10_49170 [Paenibacillus woosongensis]